jgi:hypothetical protein
MIYSRAKVWRYQSGNHWLSGDKHVHQT